MSESAKTFSLVGVAVLLAIIAVVSRPRMSSGELEGQVGQPLFSEWQDPAAAKSLEITSVDETTNSLDDFKVADVNGSWVVPSHDDYPANAKEHVFKAASSLIGLRVLAVVSNKPGDQETYGVVEPSEKTLTTSSFSGFGRLVVVKDAAGKNLAQLVVGKEDKSTAEGAPSNLRFVRRAGQDRIYRVSLDTDVLTTKFQDWVDTDILAMKQPWDVNSLQIRDYSLEQAVNRKDDVALAFDESKATWSLKQLTEYKDNQPKVTTKLPPDEELDSTKINDLKTNLSGLKLVNVARKPAGFIEKLKTGKNWLDDPQADSSLLDGGFVAFPRKNPTDVLGAGGDVTVGMKDGVEYTVRFGGAAMTLKSDSGEKKSPTSKDTKHTTVERVVFVTARFNPDLIPKPALEPLPEAKKSEPKKSEPGKTEPQKPADNKPAENKPAENKPADSTAAPTTPPPAAPNPATPAPAAPNPATSNPADAKKSSQIRRSLDGELLALADPAPGDQNAVDKKTDDKTADAKNADAKPADAKSAAATPAAAKPADAKPADKAPTATTPTATTPTATTPTATTPPAAPPSGKPNDNKTGAAAPAKPAADNAASDIKRAEEEEARETERKRIETDNRRKQDEYDNTVKQGKAHAKELNSRFANWYYMISEDEYKKLHLGLNDIVKAKPGSEAGPLGTNLQDPFSKRPPTPPNP